MLSFKDYSLNVHHIKHIESKINPHYHKNDVHLQFSNHFINRMNDTRNKHQVTHEELLGFFAKHYQNIKHYHNLGKHGEREVVLKDKNSKLNIPVVLRHNHKTKKVDMVPQTIMRKDNFISKGKTFSL